MKGPPLVDPMPVVLLTQLIQRFQKENRRQAIVSPRALKENSQPRMFTYAVRADIVLGTLRDRIVSEFALVRMRCVSRNSKLGTGIA